MATLADFNALYQQSPLNRAATQADVDAWNGQLPTLAALTAAAPTELSMRSAAQPSGFTFNSNGVINDPNFVNYHGLTYETDKALNPTTYMARWGEDGNLLTGNTGVRAGSNTEIQNLVNGGFISGSPVTTPMQQSQKSTGLTISDLDDWWKQQQAAQQNGLGTLFPRVNWGNYQTSGRGGRYFDPTTGKYQGVGNLYQTQTSSL